MEFARNSQSDPTRAWGSTGRSTLMNAPAIDVQSVSKKFRKGQRVDSIRDWFAGRLGGRSSTKLKSNEFWVLDDISFQVQPGEAFGIIGPNGAGKSTFLKLLAGIMQPDRGLISVTGPVSPLIELGAGFHPDLTGRENIYLNASILGLSRADVTARFDEIVDFAGVGDFLDTPVKRYSSGMHARLGFSIAAHVQPRVLLVDEVLSVGDRVFRTKCMEKMETFLNEGVAVVFVSHDLSAVGRFCDRAMVLSEGRCLFEGPATQAIGRYQDACSMPAATATPSADAAVRVVNVQLRDVSGANVSAVRPGDRVDFQFDVSFAKDMASPSYGFAVTRLQDHLLLFETSSSRMGHDHSAVRSGERMRVHYWFDANLPPGEYAVGLHVRERDGLQYAAENNYAARFIIDGPVIGGGCVHVAPAIDVLCLGGAPSIERFDISRITAPAA